METQSAQQTKTVKNRQKVHDVIDTYVTYKTMLALCSSACLPSVRLSVYDKPAFYQNGEILRLKLTHKRRCMKSTLMTPKSCKI